MHYVIAASLAFLMVAATAMCREAAQRGGTEARRFVLIVELAGLLVMLLHDAVTLALFWMSFFLMPWPDEHADREIIAGVIYTSIFYLCIV